MLIVEVDGPSPCFLDVSETGESAKCLWVEVVEIIASRLTGAKNVFFRLPCPPPPTSPAHIKSPRLVACRT